MTDGAGIRIVGLNELRRDLRRIDRRLPAEVLGKANQKAGEIVAGEARRRAPKGPHQGGGTVTPIAASIRAGKQQRKAVVSMGGARTPHAEPTEFGGTIPRHHSTKRTTVHQRAFLYPAIAEKRDEVVEVYAELVGDAFGEAFRD